MKIVVDRVTKTPESTISLCYVDGALLCYILEDTVREVKGRPVSNWKIAGKTAIPAGDYKVIVNLSNRFRRELPLLLDVPGYAGIRIHPGNTAADTEGCLLPGSAVGKDTVTGSKKAFDTLFAKIKAALAAGEEVWLHIN